MGVAPHWAGREPPLPTAAVVARGRAARELAVGTADRLRGGAWLRACADGDWLVVIGDAADLPWADGATFLGWESGALVPTTASPHPTTRLVREATGAGRDELVVLLPDAALVAAMPQRRADLERLT